MFSNRILKAIEAQDIQDFQKIVTRGITDPLLKWKEIEATEKLAASPNAKVVIGGKDGLQVILGNRLFFSHSNLFAMKKGCEDNFAAL